MKIYPRIALTLGVQLVLLGSVAGTYQFDQRTDQQGLIKVRPIDPDSPVKGRYLTLQVETPAVVSETSSYMTQVSLSERQGRLLMTPTPGAGQWARREACGPDSCWVLRDALAFYIPEHASIPGRAAQLWVDATLPKKGPPRPVTLLRDDGNGHLAALQMN